MTLYDIECAFRHHYFFPTFLMVMGAISIKWFFGFRRYERYCHTFVPPRSAVGYGKYVILDTMVAIIALVLGFSGHIWFWKISEAQSRTYREYKIEHPQVKLPFPTR